MCSSVSIDGDNPPWRQKILQEKEKTNDESPCICALRHMPHLDTHSHLVIYQRSKGQIVKQICEVLPNIGISVFP